MSTHTGTLLLEKNEIEKIIQELLSVDVIHPSTSPYSSPVVMVLKEGDWCMCHDFCAINKLNIKDKFPILVIADLLDDLYSASFFTKLDLRSCYHQIYMKEVDIPKTSFLTHEGHYEFLVMPFGLCNAPSTFQSLMNKILHPYLLSFFLDFFDNLLIYSRTWEAHHQHVDKNFAYPSRAFPICKEIHIFFWGARGGIFGSYCGL
jgi:hypothetical protein